MKTSKKQKEAIKMLDKFITEHKLYNIKQSDGLEDNIKIVLYLIEKLQKENKKYKRLAQINLKNAEEFKDNMCEHRCLLKSENEELKEDLKYVLNQTLGAFEKNWCIDWNFTEIREKYNLESE